ncbi:MAG: cytochrome c3 family protein [Armatimonadota bacterium]
MALGVPVLGVVGYFTNMSYATEVGVPKEQPVEFSHLHHVGDDGIDCRYCHTTVDKGPSAGMPSTHTCMTCHSQLWSDSPELELVRESFRTGKPIKWVRVHDLPDFAYFDHSIHVKKGVSCVSCHGRVDRQPLAMKEQDLTMKWCLDCHRNPAKALRPREFVYQLDWKPKKEDQQTMGKRLMDEYHVLGTFQLTNCSTCHR